MGNRSRCASRPLRYLVLENDNEILLGIFCSSIPVFEGRDKTLKLVASACYQKGELEVAENLWLEHLKSKAEQDVQCSELQHVLADLYLRMGKPEQAVTFGKKST